MLASVLLSVVVLGAPTDEDAVKLLRVAYASQYEWKEDGIKNATIKFRFEEKTTRGDEDFVEDGRGTVVIADGEIARIHAPGISDRRRKQLEDKLDWVRRRFIRKPFEERFKDHELKKPEKSAGDTTKIETNKSSTYYLKDGQIVAMDLNLGPPKKPFMIRVDFRPTDVRDGYGLLAESSSYTRGGVKVVNTKQLDVRKGDDAPSPKTYLENTLVAGTKEQFMIEFEPPTFNAENPVVLDPAARDMLKEAWAKRFTLPDGLKLVGDFQRKVDRDLSKAGWQEVGGEFQVWGMDDITTAVDTKKYRRAGGQVADTCQTQIREAFGRFKATPFEVEFKGCGFAAEESEDGKAAIIRLFGYDKAMAFRVEEGAIHGELTKVKDEEDWWLYKLKKAPDDRMLLEKMQRKIDGQRVELRFKFTKKKGQLVPTRLEALGVSQWRNALGVVTYNLRKLKITPADG